MAAPDGDRQLVARVLAGEPDAFRPLVERVGPSVVRAARRILADELEAEDVAQEAFVIAYRSLADWRGEGAFGAWVGRIAVRLAVRRAARRRTVGWIAHDEAAVPLHASEDRAEDPAVSIVRGDRAARLRAAVVGLDEPYREVVALRFFGDRTLEEIATVTGRPLNTVKTHLRRGLQRIRIALDREDLA
ncbi:MAG TPA: sigma-70 family RNA polymerase sigma factor [Candidatus Limnocylindrales bacterium]|nr:sigma-70 family RNA polymerase sigma factor [Candidatus Limnocylindrales bacterium]